MPLYIYLDYQWFEMRLRAINNNKVPSGGWGHVLYKNLEAAGSIPKELTACMGRLNFERPRYDDGTQSSLLMHIFLAEHTIYFFQSVRPLCPSGLPYLNNRNTVYNMICVNGFSIIIQTYKISPQSRPSCLHTCLPASMHSCKHAYILALAWMHAFLNACMHSRMNACMHSCMHACILECMHAYDMYACMHSWMHA